MAENLSKLRKATDRLKKLLDDPHPGLLSWQEFLLQDAKDLRDLLNEYVGDGK